MFLIGEAGKRPRAPLVSNELCKYVWRRNPYLPFPVGRIRTGPRLLRQCLTRLSQFKKSW